MKTIESEWLRYRDKVIPKDASPTQIQETKRGFYAGIHAMFGMLTRDVIEHDDENESVEEIEALYQEILRYRANIGITE